MKRRIAALLLAAVASASCAQVPDTLGGSRVASSQDCPANTSPSANYNWVDGRLVRDGWDCRRITSPL